MKILLTALLLLILFTNCSKNVKFTEEQMKHTSGTYRFNQDEVIQVFYENNDLYIKWKTGKMKPVVLDDSTFFVADMYKKLRFVKHPKTKERYLAIVSEDDDTKVEYAYLKVADTFKTPRMYWRGKNYKMASDAYTELHEQDSTQHLIDEYEVNKTGYRLMKEKDYDNAIIVLEMNTVLYPDSDNVYDSLGTAYLRKGDSLQAYYNFKKSLALNSGNALAKEFVQNYEQINN